MLKHLRRFKRDEDGNPTMEFILFLPLFMFLFLVSFEAGYYMVRGVMLERGVDTAVRTVRLSNGAVPDYPTLKRMICGQAGILPDCVDSVQIQMEQIDIAPGEVARMNAPARCVDSNSVDDPATGTNYNPGAPDQLVIVRVCAIMQPLFPTTGIGAGMAIDANGNYAIVRTAAFITEPGNRAVIDSTAGSGGS